MHTNHWLLLGVLAGLTGCLFSAAKSPGKDGAACSVNDDCKSSHCLAGFCGATDCGCGYLEACGTEGKPSADCEKGWTCVGTPVTLFVSGICELNCGDKCPSTWTCKGNYCAYIPPQAVPPQVTIVEAPDEIAMGVQASFKASATTTNGAIDSYQWNFGDGQMAEGASVTHTYSEVGYLTVQAQATDTSNLQGSTNHPLLVCLSTGSECYPFSTQGGCCSHNECTSADGGYACTVVPGP